MNGKKAIKNVYYTFSANLLTMILSTILTIFIPKLLGVREYGYWQLYMFYLSYSGFFHFGLIDGIYLKMGGENYEELDKNTLKGQFYFLLLFEILIAMSIIILSVFLINDENKRIIFILVSVSGLLNILRTFVLYILQATNRIREYARLTKMDRYIYFIFSMIYVFFFGRSFEILIFLDILSRIIVLIFCLSTIKDIFRFPMPEINLLKFEILDNLNIGMKLMFGNIAGQLIIGVIRFSIEREWSIEVFGQLSFTLSISNMFLVFVNSVSVVMFPLLRRINQKDLPKIYSSLRRVITFFSYLFLFFYPLISSVIVSFLPKFEQGILFMNILFPIFIFESRMSLISMTYFKTLRKEKKILTVNFSALLMSIVLSIFLIFYMKNLTLSIYAIVVTLGFRAFLSDIILSDFLQVNIRKDLFVELILTILFIFSNLHNAFYMYMIGIFLYIIMNANKVIFDFNFFKEKIFSK